MKRIISPPETDTTRQRILEAAETVFAERGFEAATVRQIIDRAGVKNIAAVNYYFKDKERLYIETVKAAHICCNSNIPLPQWPEGTAPQKKLRDFIHVMMRRMFEPQRPSALQLVFREMAAPSPAGAEVVREYIRPMADVLIEIVAELLPDIADGKRMLYGFSIVGQCLFYRTNRNVIVHLIGEESFDNLEVERLADHIADFTLAGLGIRG
jgi:AcrR family transcriptional regulator